MQIYQLLINNPHKLQFLNATRNPGLRFGGIFGCALSLRKRNPIGILFFYFKIYIYKVRIRARAHARGLQPKVAGCGCALRSAQLMRNRNHQKRNPQPATCSQIPFCTCRERLCRPIGFFFPTI